MSFRLGALIMLWCRVGGRRIAFVIVKVLVVDRGTFL